MDSDHLLGSDDFRCLAGVSAGDQEIDAQVDPLAEKGSEQCGSELSDGHADQAVPERLSADRFILGSRLQPERESFPVGLADPGWSAGLRVLAVLK